MPVIPVVIPIILALGIVRNPTDGCLLLHNILAYIHDIGQVASEHIARVIVEKNYLGKVADFQKVRAAAPRHAAPRRATNHRTPGIRDLIPKVMI